jgi:hypothetical protein
MGRITYDGPLSKDSPFFKRGWIFRSTPCPSIAPHYLPSAEDMKLIDRLRQRKATRASTQQTKRIFDG